METVKQMVEELELAGDRFNILGNLASDLRNNTNCLNCWEIEFLSKYNNLYFRKCRTDLGGVQDFIKYLKIMKEVDELFAYAIKNNLFKL